MTTVTVLIKTTGPTPNPVSTKPGYEIVFQMDGWSAEVDIDFGTKSPFVSQVKKFTLNGGVQALSHQSYTIDELEGSFGFAVVPTTRSNPEPPGIPPGDLEVTRDPPPDDEDQ